MVLTCGGSLPHVVTVGHLHVAFAGCAFNEKHRAITFVALSGPVDNVQPLRNSFFMQNVSELRAANLRVQLNERACHVDISVFAIKVRCSLANSTGLDNANCRVNVGMRSASWFLRLEPSGLQGGHSRGLVWVGNPVYMPSFGDERVSARPTADAGLRERFAHWTQAWQAAGLADVHMLALSEATCSGFRSIGLRNFWCTVRAPLCGKDCYGANDADLIRASPNVLALVVRNVLSNRMSPGKANEQALYNNLGLVYAQAAAYGVVAFVDIDERPGAFPLASAIADLRHRRSAVALLFHQSSRCAACPSSHADYLARSDCVRQGGAVTKPVAVPSRLSWVAVHDAYEVDRAPSDDPSATGWDFRNDSFRYATCLLHPIPLLGGSYERSAKRARYWNGTAFDVRPLRAWTTTFEAPPELYGWTA